MATIIHDYFPQISHWNQKYGQSDIEKNIVGFVYCKKRTLNALIAKFCGIMCTLRRMKLSSFPLFLMIYSYLKWVKDQKCIHYVLSV